MITQLWNRYSLLGVDEHTPWREGLKTKLVNQLGIVTAVCVVLLMPVKAMQGVKSLGFNFLCLFITLFVLYLNHKQKVSISRHISCFIFPISIFILILAEGATIGEFLIFVVCAALCFILYEGQNRLLAASLLSVLLLTISSFLFVHFNFEVNPIASNVIGTVFLFTIVLVTLGFMMVFYQREIRRFEQSQLQLLDRLHTKNIELERFAYITSHDLKEPVRNIISFSQILQKRLKNQEDERTMQYMDIILDSSQRMHSMIDSILTFSKLEHNDLLSEQVELEDIIAKITKSKKLSESDRQIEVEYSSLPQLKGNKILLSLLFQNLIENGLKYNESSIPTVKINGTEVDGVVQISVSDNGIGIDDEYADYIFEPFKRLHTRNEYDGNGLGLSICKRVVEQHEGKIWVEQNASSGSTINISFLNQN